MIYVPFSCSCNARLHCRLTIILAYNCMHSIVCIMVALNLLCNRMVLNKVYNNRFHNHLTLLRITESLSVGLFTLVFYKGRGEQSTQRHYLSERIDTAGQILLYYK